MVSGRRMLLASTVRGRVTEDRLTFDGGFAAMWGPFSVGIESVLRTEEDGTRGVRVETTMIGAYVPFRPIQEVEQPTGSWSDEDDF